MEVFKVSMVCCCYSVYFVHKRDRSSQTTTKQKYVVTKFVL